MFVVSKKNFIIQRADGSKYRIGKGYTGEIPEDVAKARLVQAAIKGGSIIAPPSHADKDIRAADESADKPAETDKSANKPKK